MDLNSRQIQGSAHTVAQSKNNKKKSFAKIKKQISDNKMNRMNIN